VPLSLRLRNPGFCNVAYAGVSCDSQNTDRARMTLKIINKLAFTKETYFVLCEAQKIVTD